MARESGGHRALSGSGLCQMSWEGCLPSASASFPLLCVSRSSQLGHWFLDPMLPALGGLRLRSALPAGLAARCFPRPDGAWRPGKSLHCVIAFGPGVTPSLFSWLHVQIRIPVWFWLFALKKRNVLCFLKIKHEIHIHSGKSENSPPNDTNSHCLVKTTTNVLRIILQEFFSQHIDTKTYFSYKMKLYMYITCILYIVLQPKYVFFLFLHESSLWSGS